MSVELPFPAINYNGKDLDVIEAIAQANRRFLDLETYLGDSGPAGTIPDRSIANVKLILGTITAAEIADGTITNAKIADGTIAPVKLDLTVLSEISEDLGDIKAGTLTSKTYDTDEGFKIDLDTGEIVSGGTTNKYFQVDKYGQLTAQAVNIQGKVLSLSGEVGPFTIGGGKLYSATVSHAGDASVWGADPNALYIDGDDSVFRLWVGSFSPLSSKFAVDKSGYLYATSPTLTNPQLNGATIGGATITSSTFSGNLTNITGISLAASANITLDPTGYIYFGSGGPSIFRSGLNLKTSSVFDIYDVQADYLTVEGGSGKFQVAPPLGLFALSGLDFSMGSTVDITQAGAFAGLSLRTADAGSSTAQSGPVWKFGQIKFATVSLNTSAYVEVDIGGVVTKLAIVT